MKAAKSVKIDENPSVQPIARQFSQLSGNNLSRRSVDHVPPTNLSTGRVSTERQAISQYKDVRALQVTIESCTFEATTQDVRYFIVATFDDGAKDLVSSNICVIYS